MAEIRTKLILRNDSIENWQDKNPVLRKGEPAIEINGTKAKLKVGSADNQSFADAPYIGSSNVYQVDLAEDDLDDEAAIAKVASDPVEGDIAIVRAPIAGTAKSYTAYVYQSGAWAAMDGNYSARNVYFKNDITLAGDYTAVGNITKSKTATETLPAAGLSLEDVMQSIFTKEIKTGLLVSKPSASISNFTEYLEIGTPASKAVTVSLSGDGEYAYGYSTTPAEPSEGETCTGVLNDKTTGVVVDSSQAAPYSIVFNGEALTSAAPNFTLTAKAATSKKELSAIGKVYYTEGKVPVSNLNKAYPAQRIAAGQATSSASAVFRWYVPYYKGFIYGFDNKLATVDITKLTKVTGATAYTAAKPTADTATGSWMQYWLVVPSSYGWNMANAKDGNGLTLDVSKQANITNNGVEYNVFVISHDAAYDTKSISWTL